MNAAFLGQWQIYRRGAPRPALVGLPPRTEGDFDSGVAAGEIRVFADTTLPLVALVVEDRRLSGWRIVPVSPFCAPASDRETMVGERVLQLWNATVVSRRFAERSWRVDSVSADDLERVRGAIAAACPGAVASGDGVQAKYEREFLVGEGNLVPFAEPCAADAPRFAWTMPAMLAAASLAVCVGAWIVLAPSSARRVADGWRNGWHEVLVGEDGGAIELVDAAGTKEPPTEIAEVDIDFTPDSAKWAGKVPGPKIVQTPKFRDVRGPKIPEGIARIESGDVQFKSPVDAPMDVVFLASAEASGASARRVDARRYGAYAEPLEKAPDVRCVFARGADADSGADAVLRIVGTGADGAKVTVMFDQETVEGYRRAADGLEPGVLARYELMAFTGREMTEKSVIVTLIWPSSGGDVRTPVVPLRDVMRR